MGKGWLILRRSKDSDDGRGVDTAVDGSILDLNGAFASAAQQFYRFATAGGNIVPGRQRNIRYARTLDFRTEGLGTAVALRQGAVERRADIATFATAATATHSIFTAIATTRVTGRTSSSRMPCPTPARFECIRNRRASAREAIRDGAAATRWTTVAAFETAETVWTGGAGRTAELRKVGTARRQHADAFFGLIIKTRKVVNLETKPDDFH